MRSAYPASSQYVTGVGGTMIPYTEDTATYWGTSNGTGGGSVLSYIPEQAWNDSLEFAYFCEANKTDSFCSGNGVGGGPLLTDWDTMQENVIGIAAGGGGPSNCVTIDANSVCQEGFGQPTWQAGLNISAIDPGLAGMTNNPTRFTPDVSLLASANFPGYLVCTEINGSSGGGSSCDNASTGIPDMLNGCIAGTGPCTIFGGTSVSSPIFAGMVTLLNQYVVAQGLQTTPGLGNFNPTLYTLAANNTVNGAFNPVTTSSSGSYSNGAFCDPGFPSSGVTGDPWPAALVCPASGTNLIGYNTYDYDPTTKYNMAVGLGSVNLSHLAAALAAVGATTTTTLGSSENPSNYGDSVTFTATVTTSGTSTPTGTVTFMDGTTTLGTGTLGCVCDGIVNSASTTYSTAALTPGTHSITAVYGGDANNAPSTSGVLSQVVNAPTFTVSTPSTPATVLSGESSTATFTVTATGTGVTTFAGNVTFACNGLPADATVTCTFLDQHGNSQIVAGTASPDTVTLTITTTGPNTGSKVLKQLRHRADNRMPWLPMTLPLAGVVMIGIAGRKRSRYSMAGALLVSVVLLGLLIACGGGNAPPAVSISVSPSASTLFPNNSADAWPPQTASFTATVTNSTNTGVNWVLSASGVTCTDPSNPCGTIAAGSGDTVNYTAPTIATGLPRTVTLTATSQADTSKTATAGITVTPTTVPGSYPLTVTGTEAGVPVTSNQFTLTVQ